MVESENLNLKSAVDRSSQQAVGAARSALLDAARALLSEHGGSRFSLATVAARSGRNSALVSYYFGGKEQMLLAILQEDEEALMGPLRELMAADLPAVQKLERHLGGMVELHARRPYLNALTHELLRRSDETTCRVIAGSIVKPVVAFQRALLEQGRIEGVFRAVDPLAFYLNVMGGVDMLFSARVSIVLGFGERSDDPALRKRFVRETMALILNGVGAP